MLSDSSRSLFPERLLFDPRTQQSRVSLNGNFDILGAPVGSADHCAQHTRDRVEKSKSVLEGIASLHDPQVALRLLRRCHGFCKLVYSSRTVPSSFHKDELEACDHLVKGAFIQFTHLVVSARLRSGHKPLADSGVEV